jgi:hypothetical protein
VASVERYMVDLPGYGHAEARLITASAREQPLPPRDRLALAAAVRDWSRLVALAERHGVLAYVQRALGEVPIVPDTARHALQEGLTAVVVRQAVLDGELRRVLRDLGAAGVPVIVLKGPALARTLYPSAAFRPYSDLDLVVPEACAERAVAALTAAGWREVPFAAEVARRGHVCPGLDAPYHRVFQTADGRAVVELHLEPLQLGLRPACEGERWRRAVPAPGLPGALMLGPDDQLVHLCVHAQKHGYSRLIWLKDIDLLFRLWGRRLDWQLVESVAAREGVGASLWYGLRLARRLLGTPVPAGALRRLRPRHPGVRLLYRLVWPERRIAGLRGHMRRRAVQLHVAESWRGVLPGLVLMGRRRTRARIALRLLLGRLAGAQ